MCQMSVYVEDDGKEELLKENVTKMEVMEKGIRLSTLFEGASDFNNMVLRHVDFSAGRAVLIKQ